MSARTRSKPANYVQEYRVAYTAERDVGFELHVPSLYLGDLTVTVTG